MHSEDDRSHYPGVFLMGLVKSFAMTASLSLLLILMDGCSQSSLVTVTRRGGISIDSSMVLTVGHVSGEQEMEFRYELKKALRANRDMQVLSADYGEEAMREATYVSIAATLSKQGKRLVVISGRYKLESNDEHKEKDGPNKTKIKYVERTLTGRFAFGLSDPPNNKLSYSRELQASATEEKDESWIVNAVVDAIVPDPVKARIRGEVIDAFMYELYPHEEFYKAKFYKDDDMPELQDGIAHANIGRWEEAIDLFHKAAEKYPNHENVHRAYYNLGIAYKWNNMFAEARENLEQAYLLKNSSEYYDEIQRLAQFEEEYMTRQKENAEPRK